MIEMKKRPRGGVARSRFYQVPLAIAALLAVLWAGGVFSAWLG
jgi:hypothetical protein